MIVHGLLYHTPTDLPIINRVMIRINNNKKLVYAKPRSVFQFQISHFLALLSGAISRYVAPSCSIYLKICGASTLLCIINTFYYSNILHSI